MNEEKLKEMAKPNKVDRAREFLQQGRKDEVYGDNEYYRKGFLDGGLYADEHPMYIYTDNEQVIANLQAEIERLKNPWRDAKKDPPKEMNIDYTSDAVIVFWQGGEIGSAIYNHDWNKWVGMHYGEDVATPLFWMPIPLLPKGGEK